MKMLFGFLPSTIGRRHAFNGTIRIMAIPNAKNGKLKPPNYLEMNRTDYSYYIFVKFIYWVHTE